MESKLTKGQIEELKKKKEALKSSGKLVKK